MISTATRNFHKFLYANQSALVRCGRSLAFFGFLGSLVAVSILCLLPSDSIHTPAIVDKVKHATAYGLIAAFGFIAFPQRAAWLPLAIGIVFWGIGVEIGQRFVPGRSFEYADMIANAAGVFFAASFLVRFRSVNDPPACNFSG